jgi:hypothetical protein
MPYPESCPECGGAFRNTGSHYTARRNEIGRHVLLELGCQNTARRYWWDFTSGQLAEDSATPARRDALAAVGAASSNGSHHAAANGLASTATLELPRVLQPDSASDGLELVEAAAQPVSEPELSLVSDLHLDRETPVEPTSPESPIAQQSAPATLKDAFVRQLQLDRLTLRQMRSWLMSEEARKAIEVAAGATEATYERLALILFGVDLPNLLGKQATAPAEPGMTAEERLELQREKARIRARLRRAAAKAARQQG